MPRGPCCPAAKSSLLPPLHLPRSLARAFLGNSALAVQPREPLSTELPWGSARNTRPGCPSRAGTELSSSPLPLRSPQGAGSHSHIPSSRWPRFPMKTFPLRRDPGPQLALHPPRAPCTQGAGGAHTEFPASGWRPVEEVSAPRLPLPPPRTTRWFEPVPGIIRPRLSMGLEKNSSRFLGVCSWEVFR